MTNFLSFTGRVTMINDFFTNENDGCHKIITVENGLGGIVNFVVSPSTFIVDHVALEIGDHVTGYYDGDAPAILIYPPQYPALVMVKNSPYQNVKVDYFNQQLVSSDGQLQLNISPFTKIFIRNGLSFTNSLANRDLIVIYGAATKSIPAITTPYRIIVLC